jgi:hypothetical protein
MSPEGAYIRRIFPSDKRDAEARGSETRGATIVARIWAGGAAGARAPGAPWLMPVHWGNLGTVISCAMRDGYCLWWSVQRCA